MKKRPIWLTILAVILCLSGFAALGSMDSFGENAFALVVALCCLYWLLSPLLPKGWLRRITTRKHAEAAGETVPQRPASDPVKVDYPFHSYGMARAIEPSDFIVLDTETTGFSPRDDKIIEVGALKIRNGETTRFHSLINPGRRIPQSSIRVHGITDADVAAAPSFAQILPDLDSFLDRDLPIVGQSVTYDLQMLWWAYHDACADIGERRYIDTAKLAKKAFPGRKSYSLASLIEDYELIPGEQQHRSESDVDATLALYRLCCDELGGKK
ncbi:MAG: 3'-5' exonuclease [Oscillospiraceae bacterium]|nr:3'-5' exonuclease [Oscillospiraceae bacterium]